MDTFVFLDTNSFLHYRSVEEINWLDLLNVDAVTIMISQIVIRELNKQKDLGDKKRIRRRARSALTKLTPYLRRARPVREFVDLRFRENDPTIDFQTHKLNDKIADDWLIATILESRDEYPDSRIILVTNDLGLQLKAAGHGLECIEIPERYLLPDELDPDEIRIRELERDLSIYKNKVPHLNLTFENGKDHIRFRCTKIPLMPEAVISEKMANIRVAHPKASKPAMYSGADLMLGHAGPNDIDRHNIRMDWFYVAYEKYLKDSEDYNDRQRRIIMLNITLLNSGFSPAEDIDVYMHFPDGSLVAENAESFLKTPVEPQAPDGPKSQMIEQMEALARIAPSYMPNAFASKLDFENLNRNVSGPTIRRTNSIEVHVHVRELKHNLQVGFDPLFLLFDSWDTAKSFAIEYRLLAANVPLAVTGNLHVIVDAV